MDRSLGILCTVFQNRGISFDFMIEVNFIVSDHRSGIESCFLFFPTAALDLAFRCANSTSRGSRPPRASLPPGGSSPRQPVTGRMDGVYSWKTVGAAQIWDSCI